jgi:DNA-binding FadR family transcriptional regulator
MIKSAISSPAIICRPRAQMGIASGISRPPLREALKALTLMGVLKSRQGGRYCVTDLSPSRLVAGSMSCSRSATMTLTNTSRRARSSIWNWFACVPSVRRREQRERIMRHAVHGKAFFRDPVPFRLLNVDFHGTLNEAGGNRLFATLARGLYDIGLDVRRAAAAAAHQQYLEHVRDTKGPCRSLPEQIDFRMTLFPGKAAEYREAPRRDIP